jgi:hypothetical protein
MIALGVIALVLLLTGSIVAIFTQTRRKGLRDHTRAFLPPAGQQPDPHFTIQRNNGDPGFTVLRRTNGHAPLRPPSRKPSGPAPRSGRGGFNYVVNANPTAICKLTGKQASDCGCDVHKGKV